MRHAAVSLLALGLVSCATGGAGIREAAPRPSLPPAGELRFSGGIVSGDVNGDGRADFEIKMNGVTKMYSDDFFL